MTLPLPLTSDFLISSSDGIDRSSTESPDSAANATLIGINSVVDMAAAVIKVVSKNVRRSLLLLVFPSAPACKDVDVVDDDVIIVVVPFVVLTVNPWETSTTCKRRKDDKDIKSRW
jgi:hypothetical protein